MANTNIAATGAICCRPVTMNFAVASPKPPASAAAIGTAISATSGDANRLTMRTNSVATVRKPSSASTVVSSSLRPLRIPFRGSQGASSMSDSTISVRRVSVLTAALAATAGALAAVAQVQTNVPDVVAGARPAIVERITIHGQALEGNLEADAVDREAFVFLPPGYNQNRTRRYPVVYALHGYSIGAEQWTHEIHVPQTIEGAFAKGARPMIVVFPDSKTVHNGSMYSNSVTTGHFEDYIWRDVVSYVDEHYRTLPDRDNRGLVGHSMGGYGASRIGMKHPDVFGSLYIMSPCCLSARGAGPANSATDKAL